MVVVVVDDENVQMLFGSMGGPAKENLNDVNLKKKKKKKIKLEFPLWSRGNKSN